MLASIGKWLLVLRILSFIRTVEVPPYNYYAVELVTTCVAVFFCCHVLINAHHEGSAIVPCSVCHVWHALSGQSGGAHDYQHCAVHVHGVSLTPSHHHTLTPSHHHTLTPSHHHPLTPSHPHTHDVHVQCYMSIHVHTFSIHTRTHRHTHTHFNVSTSVP